MVMILRKKAGENSLGMRSRTILAVILNIVVDVYVGG